MSKSHARASSITTQSATSKRSSPKAPLRGASATAVAKSPARSAATSTPRKSGSATAGTAVKAAPAATTAVTATTAKKRGVLTPRTSPARTDGAKTTIATRTAPRVAGGRATPSRVIEVTAPVRTLASANPPIAPPSTSALLDPVWIAYGNARERQDEARLQDLRNKLIERYYDVVRYAAERMHTRLPNEVDVNDLMSAGLFGLMDAIDAFDPHRGVKFETYCAPRIRGAIFDELRAMDWVPRLVRSRTSKVEKVRKEFELSNGRKPTDDEVASLMNVSSAEYDKLQKDSRPVGVVSLDRKAFESDSSRDVREVDVIEDGRQLNPAELVQRGDLQGLITKGLSRAERLIVILYYYEEMTMKEIGLTLDLSESRVSQMHSSILARLKAQMQHRMKEF
ncbi:MAG: polymerase sigma factor FliA [Planctomycetota bacterium]